MIKYKYQNKNLIITCCMLLIFTLTAFSMLFINKPAANAEEITYTDYIELDLTSHTFYLTDYGTDIDEYMARTCKMEFNFEDHTPIYVSFTGGFVYEFTSAVNGVVLDSDVIKINFNDILILSLDDLDATELSYIKNNAIHHLWIMIASSSPGHYNQFQVDSYSQYDGQFDIAPVLYQIKNSTTTEQKYSVKAVLPEGVAHDIKAFGYVKNDNITDTSFTEKMYINLDGNAKMYQCAYDIKNIQLRGGWFLNYWYYYQVNIYDLEFLIYESDLQFFDNTIAVNLDFENNTIYGNKNFTSEVINIECDITAVTSDYTLPEDNNEYMSHTPWVDQAIQDVKDFFNNAGDKIGNFFGFEELAKLISTMIFIIVVAVVIFAGVWAYSKLKKK